MNDQDHKAAEELASDMSLTEAAKFLRGECGGSLIYCKNWAENIAVKYPLSKLNQSVKNRKAN